MVAVIVQPPPSVGGNLYGVWMTDIPAGTEPEPEIVGSLNGDPALLYDPMLHTLVAVANSGSGFTITLSVAGGFISGRLIGQNEYLDEAQAMWADWVSRNASDDGDNDDEPTEPIFDGFRIVPDELPEPNIYRFIHMKDAHWFVGDGMTPGPPGPGVLWRGRLSQVAGWSWGQLGATPN
jgi:hypothetical protein